MRTEIELYSELAAVCLIWIIAFPG